MRGGLRKPRESASGGEGGECMRLVRVPISGRRGANSETSSVRSQHPVITVFFRFCTCLISLAPLPTQQQQSEYTVWAKFRSC